MKFNTVEEYILSFPESTRKKLYEIREIIKNTVPDASEKISYNMPTFYLKGNLVHFAAFKNHIGFYPLPGAVKNFENDLAPYKHAKGSVQFSLALPLPKTLIEKIVIFRKNENLKK